MGIDYSSSWASEILKPDVIEDKEDTPTKNKIPPFLDKYLHKESARGKIISAKGGIRFPKYSLFYENVQFAPRGGLHVVTGQSGHGKTMLNSILITAYLNGECLGIKRNFDDVSRLKVLFADTEQEVENSALVRARVHELAGMDINADSPDFILVNTSESDNAKQHIEAILNAIEEYRPDVVFIDGLMDLVDSMNNEEQCREVVNDLTKIARYYNVNLWCVLHQNPNDKKMAGHLGSFLERKCTDVLSILFKEKCFHVKHGKARAGHIPTFYFELGPSQYNFGKNSWKIPKSMSRLIKKQEEEVIKTEEKTDNGTQTPSATQILLNEETLNKKPSEPSVIEAMNRIFVEIGDSKACSTVRETIRKILHVGPKKADELLKKAEERRIISKEPSPNGNGNVYIYQFFTNFNDEELPF